MQVVEQAEEADLYIPVNRGKFQIRTSIKSTHLKMFYESNFLKNIHSYPASKEHHIQMYILFWAVFCFLCFCILGGKNSFHIPGINVYILVLMLTCVAVHQQDTLQWNCVCFWAGGSCSRPL